MSAAPEVGRAVTALAPAAPPTAPHGRAPTPAPPPAPARRSSGRLGQAWLARVAWSIHRTGRPGLIGLALAVASVLFLFSTHLPVAAEVEALHADLASAQRRAPVATAEAVVDPASALRALPARTDMPAILRQMFEEAVRARLAVDTGRYDIKETSHGGVVRYHVTFPVTGPYPQIRAFLDGTLARMPAVALSDLLLERKTIADGDVAAQIRMTLYTVATGGTSAGTKAAGPDRRADPHDRDARPASDRVVPPTHAASLFAQHSWVVLKKVKLPPPPPPEPAPPPPAPTAPPLPYAFVGSFTPQGGTPVFFLARGDRVIDAHVGDKLDGVYQLESVAGGQLVFVYLPLDIRQTIPTGASK